MTVAAVVVSYNRVDLLRKCLSALQDQDHIPDEIIVVDNGSSDGSQEVVRTEYPFVTLFETERNLGGAGGFAWGVELAIKGGHSEAWLMDDDAEPHLDSLGVLVRAMSDAPDRPGFIASLVVNAAGEPSRQHLPEVSQDPARQLAATQLGGVATESASFVGVLVDLRRSKVTELPYSDFFIWFDDAEYTRRLAASSYGVLMPASRVFHPEKENRSDMAGRLFYYLRNRIWLHRLDQTRVKTVRSWILLVWGLVSLSHEQLGHSQSGRLWAACVYRGFRDGIFKTPAVTMPGDLIASLRVRG